MSLAGLGAVCIWHDLLPEARDDFHQWHNREHMPGASRHSGISSRPPLRCRCGTPEYFNLYEADSPEVLGGQGLSESPECADEWTRRVVPSVPQRVALDLPRGLHRWCRSGRIHAHTTL
jgi:hypothetical protein